VPDVSATIAPGVIACHDLDAALHSADVVMSLRIQKERLAGHQIGLEDYIAKYQVTPQRMKLARPDAIVMHPGPIVRGLELANEVADGPQSCVHEQVANGVKTRMAILATVLEVAQ
jgi:aspartate carbamoyltransferase catalytic subunit